MTRTHLRWVTAAVVALYALAICVGVYLRRPFGEEPTGLYSAYKDLMPLIIAIPAAYLAFAFQRRNSYLQALRGLWSDMVEAVTAALIYTEAPSPTQDQYFATLQQLSAAIEEVRGVFKNVPTAGSEKGWYPFEPVKQIYRTIYELGYGEDAAPERRADANRAIYTMWSASRDRLLAEFDRDKPTYHHAEYAAAGPRPGRSAPKAEQIAAGDVRPGIVAE